jgi:hypothetical protein
MEKAVQASWALSSVDKLRSAAVGACFWCPFDKLRADPSYDHCPAWARMTS